MTTAENSDVLEMPEYPVLFSIIIPVYNDGVRLQACLEAIAAQRIGLDNIEVLIVDNGSRESPADVVARHRFARILHEPRPGSYAARNMGVAAARGRLLAFTDSDCRPHPDWLSNAWDYLQSEPDVHAIGGHISLDKNSSPSGAELYERLYAFPQQTYVNRDGFAATANMIVRREVFDTVGDFNGSLRSGGDREWGQRMSKTGFRIDYQQDVVVSHPPRTSLQELIRKHRRVVGVSSLPRHTLAEIRPDAPRRSFPIGMGPRETWFVLLLVPGKVGFRRLEGLRVLAVRALMGAVRRYELLRLRLGGEPLR